VTDPIPKFLLPLQPGDNEPTIDLKQLLEQLYDQGSYDLRLNYAQIPEPAFSPDDQAWIAANLRPMAR
jgi:hypothetical protein